MAHSTTVYRYVTCPSANVIENVKAFVISQASVEIYVTRQSFHKVFPLKSTFISQPNQISLVFIINLTISFHFYSTIKSTSHTFQLIFVSFLFFMSRFRRNIACVPNAVPFSSIWFILFFGIDEQKWFCYR